MFDQQLSVTEPQGLLSIFQRHGENFQLTDLWKKNTVNPAISNSYYYSSINSQIFFYQKMHTDEVNELIQT